MVFNEYPITTAMKVWGFPILYLGWAYLFWIPIFTMEESVWSFPPIIFFLAGGASPLLAGIIMAGIYCGRAGILDLLRRLTDVRRIRPCWWLIILAFWPLFDLFMAGAAMLLGVTSQPLSITRDLFSDPGMLVFLLLLSFVFPAVEEIGLRGYYLDALRERFSLTTAGLINGATWAAWHAPFVWFPGYYENTTFNPSLSWWLPMIIFTTLMIVQVYEKTHRSILAVLLFHGMMNLTGEILGISSAMYPFILSGYLLAAVILIILWRSTTTCPRNGQAGSA